MFRFSSMVLAAAWLAVGSYSRPALAQNTPPTEPPPLPPPPPTGTEPANGGAATSSAPPVSATGAPAPAPAPAPAAAAPNGGATVVVATPAPAPSFVPVIEILPPSAYPTPQTGPRGIYGGSLWLEPDLQGMQWPYYPKTGLGISGSGWVDTGIRQFNAGEATPNSPGLGTQASKGTQFVQQSRFVLRATPTWAINDKLFIQAQTEFVGAKIDTTNNKVVWGADDAWIRFGWWNKFDILLGRFQAWEVYHYGMGLDLYTLERNGANDDPQGNAPQIYGLTYMYQRQDVLGQGAVHLYPTDWLRFEVGFQYGAGTNGSNTDGVRPVGVADFPVGGSTVIRVKAGAEFLDSKGQTEGAKFETQSQGVGGAIQAVIDPYLEVGFNGAYAWNDARDAQGRISTTGRNQTYSVGGFANARIIKDLLIGGGFNYTFLVDSRFDPNAGRDDNYDQYQPFGAIQYLLWNHLFIKAVFAYARADLNPVPQQSTTFRNEMWSARLRLLYLL